MDKIVPPAEKIHREVINLRITEIDTSVTRIMKITVTILTTVTILMKTTTADTMTTTATNPNATCPPPETKVVTITGMMSITMMLTGIIETGKAASLIMTMAMATILIPEQETSAIVTTRTEEDMAIT